jgi:hypothetical protein
MTSNYSYKKAFAAEAFFILDKKTQDRMSYFDATINHLRKKQVNK